MKVIIIFAVLLVGFSTSMQISKRSGDDIQRRLRVAALEYSPLEELNYKPEPFQDRIWNADEPIDAIILDH